MAYSNTIANEIPHQKNSTIGVTGVAACRRIDTIALAVPIPPKYKPVAKPARSPLI
ncbi:hypothetical protein [Brunnivagina elsteri]|uniref:hypothetical protein n=1 Tax=Brunnivagina elsteri TaxID=1247191 RepID=UPI001B80A9E7|nr:hypothetical protein [Calothrix elsteri]